MVLVWLTEGVVCLCQNDLQFHSYTNCFVHKSVSCEVVLITFSVINTYLQHQFSIETSLGHEFIFAKTSVSICTLC